MYQSPKLTNSLLSATVKPMPLLEFPFINHTFASKLSHRENAWGTIFAVDVTMLSRIRFLIHLKGVECTQMKSLADV
jgi:hypothetical protein